MNMYCKMYRTVTYLMHIMIFLNVAVLLCQITFAKLRKKKYDFCLWLKYILCIFFFVDWSLKQQSIVIVHLWSLFLFNSARVDADDFHIIP